MDAFQPDPISPTMPAYVGDKPLAKNPKPIPQEGNVAAFAWKLTFWMKQAPNADYATAPISLDDCEKLKEKIIQKQYFVAPMATINGAYVHYDGAEVYAFQIEKVIVN